MNPCRSRWEVDGIPALPGNAASACLGETETRCCTQMGASRESVLDFSRPLLNQDYVPLENLNLSLKL